MSVYRIYVEKKPQFAVEGKLFSQTLKPHFRLKVSRMCVS